MERTDLSSTLLIPNDLALVGPMVAFVGEVAAASGFDEREVSQIRLALEEAATNVIRHGFEPGERSTIEVEVKLVPEGVIVALRDQGLPFDPSLLPVYNPAGSGGDPLGPGLGTYLMYRSVDEVAYQNLGRRGKEIRLKKLRAASRVDALSTREQMVRHGDAPVPSDEKATCTTDIRPLREHEAIEVSRCAYRAYGYSYEDFVYCPDQIVALNREGLLHSLVAVTPEGRIAGHIALKRQLLTDSVAEVGVAFVAPAFRGGGLLRRLTEAIHHEAEQLGFRGVYVRAVTSHHASQRASYSEGYRPSGILLAMFPADVDFKQLTGPVRQRENALLAYRLLPRAGEDVPCTTRPLGVPAHHRDMVATIYRWLGIEAVFAESDEEVTHGQDDPCGEIDVKTSTVLNTVQIVVRGYGSRIVEQVRSRLRDFCLHHFDAIFLLVNLERTMSASLICSFEEMGFFFAGILPFGSGNQAAMVLQYLNNYAIDYDRLEPFSQEAKQLAAYVRAHDPSREP